MATTLRNTRNPLLAKDDVGKARTSCYDLPEDGFAYGRPDNPDFEGAREVTMQWISHKATPRAAESIQDFRKLNKLAITEKALTARAVAKHRRSNDLPLSARSTFSGPPAKVIPSDVVPSFTYGKKTRPSTPIASVVSYQFSSEFEDDIMNQYEFLRMKKEHDAQIRRIPLTKATRGHASAVKKVGAEILAPKELFKITKFKKVLCKVAFPGGKTSTMKKLIDEAEERAGVPEEIQEGVEAYDAAKETAPATGPASEVAPEA
jgi:hypothetical protein